ncbi:MFS transporter [Sphingobium yanoikuyae]|uniref:MFS transporter n=2 Tax=Sphingobium TaxID=165695 RepID=A0A6M4G5M9_SPHYA|nr:MFS transporter [Sphingobium yanoikuyae]QJR02399.1 MFS transporter [Sphingobium yanoikuyae]
MKNGSTAAVIGALWVAEITGSFETAMIYAAQRALTDDLGDPVRVGWLITSYLLIGAGAAALAGRLGDIFGRRRLMLAMLAVGFVGSLVSTFSANYPMLLAGRCLQGLTGAILPLCVGLVRENLPPRKVPMGIGLMISGASAGTACGLVIGGMIVDHFSWHGVFFASALFAATAFAAIYLALPRSPRIIIEGRLDWVGGILFVPAIFALLLAITSGPRWGLADWRTGAATVSGLTLLVLWIWTSLRTARPLFDVRLFANSQVFIANAVTALVAMSTLQITLVFSLLLQAPTWTQIGLGATATLAGLAKLPSNIGSLAAGPLSGWMTSRGGGRTTMITGGLLTTAGWLLAMFFNDSILVVTMILILISFGATMQFAVGPTILAGAVPPDRTSEAAGMMTVMRQAFLGVGAQMVSVLLATSTVATPGGGASYPTTGAFFLAMGVIVALCITATLLAFALPRNAGVAAD